MADEIRHLTEGVAFRNLHQTWRYFKQTILPQSPVGDSSLQRELGCQHDVLVDITHNPPSRWLLDSCK